jgi:hypothetical protein
VHLSGALGESIQELGLLPVEIRHARTAELSDRVLLRSLEQKLQQLGEGEWLVTVALPTGKRLSVVVKTDSVGRIDAGDLASKLVNSASELLKAMLPTVAQIGKEVGGSSIAGPLAVVQNINWKGIVGNVMGLAVEKAMGALGGIGLDTFQGLPQTASPPTSYGPAHPLHHPDARLCFFHGSVLDGTVKEIPQDKVSIQRFGDTTRVSDPGGELLIVQLLRPSAPASNFLLPRGSAVSLSPAQPDGAKAVSVSVTFGDSLTDHAVSFRAGDNLQELQTIAGGLTTHDVQSLREKPEGAAVCLLYLILRTRDVETVELALRSLPGDAGNAPDVAVIKAELAARRGQHRDALHGYLGATVIGLPWFGQGVSYLANRLRLYEKMMDRQSLEFSNDDREKTTSVLQQIESFSASCDYSAPVTTYSGPHPARPGSASLTRTEFLATKGFPISP